MMVKLKHWMEKFLQDPFYQAELMRAEILTDDNDLLTSLVGSLNHNYHTLKTWSE